MDKAAWWATIQMVARIRHDFASKQQQQHCQARSTNCFLHLQEHILGIINWAHWAGCVCHATIVLLFWGMFCCLVLLLSKPAWFCGLANLLSWIIINLQESSLFFSYLQSPSGINSLITYFVHLLCPYQLALHLKPDEFLKGKRLNWDKVAREQTAENERWPEGQPMPGHMVVSQKPQKPSNGTEYCRSQRKWRKKTHWIHSL